MGGVNARLGDLETALSAKRKEVAYLYEPDESTFGVARDTEIRAASKKKSTAAILSEVGAGDFSTVLAYRGYPASMIPLNQEQYTGAMNRYAASVAPEAVDTIVQAEAAKAVLTQQRDQLDSYAEGVVREFTPVQAAGGF